LEEEIRLPTMEDLYFQKNDKTLKEVPRQHCQATTLQTSKKWFQAKWASTLGTAPRMEKWQRSRNPRKEPDQERRNRLI
jgi:hypothetical protein